MSEGKPRYEWIAEMMYEAGMYTQSEEVRKMGQEISEQCRLLAMGSEREARLTARVAELEAALRQASLCIRQYVPVGNDRGFTLTIINLALNAARGTE